MPSAYSPVEQKKRSLSPSRDEHKDRRRRYHENDRNEKDRGEGNRWSSKRPSQQNGNNTKYQRTSYETRDRGRRASDDDAEEGEDKPTRASRFVGERKPEDYRRIGRSDILPDDRRQYRNDRFNVPPSRWGESANRRNFDGGARAGGAGAGYSRRTSTFGRWGGGRGRGRGRTVVYRPGEDEEKPTMNLFDPTKVPKGRNYFEHEDRSDDLSGGRFRGRGRGRFRGGRTFSDRDQWKNRSDDYGGRSDAMWQHDLYEQMETSEPEKGTSADVAMEEAK